MYDELQDGDASNARLAPRNVSAGELTGESGHRLQAARARARRSDARAASWSLSQRRTHSGPTMGRRVEYL